MIVRVHFMNEILSEVVEDTFTFSCDNLEEAKEIIEKFFSSRAMNFEKDYLYSELIKG